MNDYFDSEILRIERELSNLKVSQQKFAGDMVTVTKTIGLNMPLILVTPTLARAIVKIRLTVDDSAIISFTLNKYYDNIMLNKKYPRETRSAQLTISKYSSGQYLAQITAFGTQTGYNNDVEVLSGGGSVVLNYTLSVQCTDDFEMEII